MRGAMVGELDEAATMSDSRDERPTDESQDFEMSPSETFAHNSAMRVSGANRGDSPHRTQRALASIVLGFELIVVFLIGMTIFGLSLLDPPELGIWGGVIMCASTILALSLMRVGFVGIIIGWVVHVLMFLSAIVLPMVLIVAVIFTALWVYCMIKGAKIDREREAWLAG